MEGELGKILKIKDLDRIARQNADIEATLAIEEKLKSLALVEIRRAVGTTQTNSNSADAIDINIEQYKDSFESLRKLISDCADSPNGTNPRLIENAINTWLDGISIEREENNEANQLGTGSYVYIEYADTPNEINLLTMSEPEHSWILHISKKPIRPKNLI